MGLLQSTKETSAPNRFARGRSGTYVLPDRTRDAVSRSNAKPSARTWSSWAGTRRPNKSVCAKAVRVSESQEVSQSPRNCRKGTRGT